jgi:hypothetical protein
MSTFRNNKGSVVGMASKKGSTVTARDVDLWGQVI